MVRTRLAPSPTGDPHIGTLFQALFDYCYAQKHHGKFIVRIEDTDQKRQVASAETAIFKALDWLGLIPDESPLHPGSFGPYRQSERLALYQQFAQKLVKAGHAYYCFCSDKRLKTVRADQQQKGLPTMYDRHCRHLDTAVALKKAQSVPCVIRLKVPARQTIVVHDLLRGDIKFDSDVLDDQVLLKSDGFPTYHLAVVVDDHLMEITHVVRGEEWLSSSPKHLLLYQYFNWQPPIFIHTPLLRNPDRSKLSKRHGHASVSWYQKQGYLKEAVINFLATRAWNHPQGKEVFNLAELIDHFDFKQMHIQGPIADIDKLNWLNGQWIRQLSEAELMARLQSFKPQALSLEKLKLILPLIKDRLEKLSQLPDLTAYFIKKPQPDIKAILKESKTDAFATAAYFSQVEVTLNGLKTWSVAHIENSLHALQQKLNWKPRPAFMTLRIAVTGRSATPPLFDVLAILGKTSVIKRLHYAQTLLKKA